MIPLFGIRAHFFDITMDMTPSDRSPPCIEQVTGIQSIMMRDFQDSP